MDYGDHIMILINFNSLILLGLLKIIVDAISPKKILFKWKHLQT